MGNPLRERRSAAEWAAESQVIEIADKIGNFGQLSAIVEADLAALDADKMPAKWRDTVVSGCLEFGFADAQQMLPAVRCRARVEVDAVCQRCLGAFRLPLEVGPIFEARLAEAFPLRHAKVMNAIVDVRGGRKSDSRFGSRMVGQGQRWLAIEQLFAAQCDRLGLSYASGEMPEPPTAHGQPASPQLTLDL